MKFPSIAIIYISTYSTKACGSITAYKCTVAFPFQYKQVHEMVSAASKPTTVRIFKQLDSDHCSVS